MGFARPRRRHGCAAGRAGRAAGEDRRLQRLGARAHASTSRWTRCAARPATPTSTKLSGGERRRVALCRLLLSNPDMLLLDEPTNHLDAESVAWLERFLAEYKSTVVAVTHDRYFLDNVAGWILELDRGRGIPYEGNYTGWLEQKRKRLRAGGARGQGAPADAGARAGVDRPEPAGAARQVQGAHLGLRGSARPGARPGAGERPDRDPARPAPGRPGDRGRGPDQGASATGC